MRHVQGVWLFHLQGDRGQLVVRYDDGHETKRFVTENGWHRWWCRLLDQFGWCPSKYSVRPTMVATGGMYVQRLK